MEQGTSAPLVWQHRQKTLSRSFSPESERKTWVGAEGTGYLRLQSFRGLKCDPPLLYIGECPSPFLSSPFFGHSAPREEPVQGSMFLPSEKAP